MVCIATLVACSAEMFFRSLNQHIDIDLSDKTSGVILDRQLGVVGLKGRLFHAVLSSCAVIVILWFVTIPV